MSTSDEKRTGQNKKDWTVVYQQLCSSYHAIDDFRAKLLGFLPLASGAGIFLLLNDVFTDPDKSVIVTEFLLPIGIFGFVVTLGLFSYEIYGIRKCGALIEAGKQLEHLLGVKHAQFKKRPREVAGLINEPFAAGIIYPAVLAAWTFVALWGLLDGICALPNRVALLFAMLFAILVFVTGFVFTLIYDLWLRKDTAKSGACKQSGNSQEGESVS
jgi:hypothetical protein